MDNLSNTLGNENNAGGKEIERENVNEQVEILSTDKTNTSFGKFSSSDELLKAYNNLESQFTKRSQELKRLERENNMLRSEQADFVEHSDDSDTCAQSHAVQDETGSAAKERTGEEASENMVKEDEQISEEVGKFLKLHPEAVNYVEAIAEKTYQRGDVENGFLERAYIEVLKDALNVERSKINDDFIYEKVVASPSVKEKLIRDYLNDVSKGSPMKLISDSGESAVMPPKRPVSIFEAGAMAEKILKRK